MPTIDPSEFSDAGHYVPSKPQADALIDLTNLDDENLHPQGSPGWALLQEERAARKGTAPVQEQDEDRQRTAEQRAKAKHAAANAAFQIEAQQHKEAMAQAAAEKQSELETVLGCMDEHEARAVRMQAYLRALDAGHGNQRERQLHADTLALKIANYMVTGRAE